MHKFVLVTIACLVAIGNSQDGENSQQAVPQGPITRLLSGIHTPRLGYAPGVHQAIANTGAQPNPFNLFPGLTQQGGGASGQNPLAAPVQAFQNLAHGLAQTTGQLFNAALAPLAQIAQGFAASFNTTTATTTTGINTSNTNGSTPLFLAPNGGILSRFFTDLSRLNFTLPVTGQATKATDAATNTINTAPDTLKTITQE